MKEKISIWNNVVHQCNKTDFVEVVSLAFVNYWKNLKIPIRNRFVHFVRSQMTVCFIRMQVIHFAVETTCLNQHASAMINTSFMKRLLVFAPDLACLWSDERNSARPHGWRQATFAIFFSVPLLEINLRWMISVCVFIFNVVL